jgi:hypothetical protein|tara:strand:+ start:3286 stop:3435 length:150 start_codon:yes stop_codon:yes gene_type:complete
MAIQKSDIKSLIYKTKQNSALTITVSDAEKVDVDRIVGNFFSYVLDKHS